MKKSVTTLLSGIMILTATTLAPSCQKLGNLTLNVENPAEEGTTLTISQGQTIEIPFSIGQLDEYTAKVSATCDNELYTVEATLESGAKGKITITAPEFIFEDATFNIELTAVDADVQYTGNDGKYIYYTSAEVSPIENHLFRIKITPNADTGWKGVEGIVIGGHGDTTMIPLTRYAAYRGIPASTLLEADTLAKVAADTMVGGATLTGLLGTSAWYAPGAAAAQVAAAVIHDQKKLIPCSAMLEGEYGESDICIGVPCILGKGGIEKIVEFDLNDEEKALFKKSADAVRNTNAALA